MVCRKVCSVNGRAQEALGSLTRTAALCHGRPCEETVGPKLRGSPCKHRRLRTTPTLCRFTDLESVPKAMTGGAAEVSALVRVTARMIERPSASGTYRRRYHKLRLTDIALNASIEPCRVGLPNRPGSRFPSRRRRLLRALASGGKPCIRGVTASSCRSHAGPCLDSRRGSGRRSRPGRDAPGDFARGTSTRRSLSSRESAGRGISARCGATARLGGDPRRYVGLDRATPCHRAPASRESSASSRAAHTPRGDRADHHGAPGRDANQR